MLLTILLLQAGGILFVYKVQQYYVKAEMQKTLNGRNTQFQKVSVSLGDYLKNKIGSDEISIDGKMFDIKSIQISGKLVELLVINDNKEDNIIEKIKDFIDTTNQSNTELPLQLQQLLSLNYLPLETGFLLFIPVFSVDFFLRPILNFVSNDLEILTPPPKLI